MQSFSLKTGAFPTDCNGILSRKLESFAAFSTSARVSELFQETLGRKIRLNSLCKFIKRSSVTLCLSP